LATGRPAVVYMQNSGQGNAINPLASLAHRDVYGIPMVLIIGWRGQPGVSDEPQHMPQGRITPRVLELLDIGHEVLAHDEAHAVEQVKNAVQRSIEEQSPTALLVEKGTFAARPFKPASDACPRERESAIADLLEFTDDADLLVATTGKIGRELHELRENAGHDGAGDFLTVGSMGHASHLALGLAMGRPDRRVFCIDGDGALLMHTGALAMIGTRAPKNLFHVVLNNGVHDSVGGQPTVGRQVDFVAMASACGYRHAHRVGGTQSLGDALDELVRGGGPGFLDVEVRPGARADLGRPGNTPRQRTEMFRNRVENP
jgi:phosphonopyruvate decarboxylase